MNELNRRFKELRISMEITQRELSSKSGVSERCIINFENGSDIKVSSLTKMLEALGMNDAINELIPDMTNRPSYRAKLEAGKTRKRVRKSKMKSSWTWGD